MKQFVHHLVGGDSGMQLEAKDLALFSGTTP